MSFSANSFIFDSVPSEAYNLFIMSPDGGDVEVTGSSNVTPVTQAIFRRPVPYFYGVKHEPVLQFEVAFISPNEIDASMSSLISKWLFGRPSYRKLQIVQSDMTDIYFNCFLVNPRLYKVGNAIFGVRATVLCDAPWAWEMDKTMSWTWDDSQTQYFQEILQFDSFIMGDYDGQINRQLPCFFNTADTNDFVYPTVTFTINRYGGGFGLTSFYDRDEYDQARSFSFSRMWPIGSNTPNLNAREKIVVNNDLQTITSYVLSNNVYVKSGLKRLERFGYTHPVTGRWERDWFRFKPGANMIVVSGTVTALDITYKFPRKISG